MEVGKLMASLDLEMSGFTKQLANAQKNLQGMGEKMKGIGEKMSLAVSAPIALAGGVMLKGASDAQAAQGKLQASLGITKAAAADLSAVAQATWANGFGQSVDEANQAIISIRQNMGDLAEDEMGAISEGALTIQELFGEEVSASTAAAGVMMKQFGIDGQHAMDLITVGFQKGGNFSGELLDTMREYGPQFAEMGFSADEMLNTLIKGTEAGAWNMDKIGDAVKEFHIRAQDGSKTTAEGFKAIGLDANEMGSKIAAGGEQAQSAFMATIAALANMKDPLAQDAAGVALFGTQWEDVRAKVITAMADGKNALGEVSGATATATAAMQENNPAWALTQAFRKMQLAIGPVLLDVANVIIGVFVPALKGITGAFDALPGPIKTAIIVLIGIVAAIGPLLVAFAAISSAVVTLGPIFVALGAAFGVVASAAAAILPVLAGVSLAVVGVVGVFGMLVAAGVYVYKHWDELKAKTKETFDSIKETISNAIDGAKQAVSQKLEQIKQFFVKWGPSILLALTGPIGAVVSLIVKNWDNIKNSTSNIWNGIKSFFVSFWQAYIQIVTNNLNAAKNTLTNSWNAMKTSTMTVWNGIKTGIMGVWTGIKSGVSSAASGVVSTLKTTLNGAWSYIKSIPSQAVGWGKSIIQGLANGIRSIHIPMPHISMSLSSKSIGGVSIPMPNFSVNWYDKGGVFNSPAVIGVGEKRPEFVGALDDLRKIVREESGNGGPIQLNVYLDSRVISQQLYYQERGQFRGGGRK